MGFKGRDRGSRFLRALMPFTLKVGLMKPRKGFTPVTGKEKLGVGSVSNSVKMTKTDRLQKF
jgi:hypothetical protein